MNPEKCEAILNMRSPSLIKEKELLASPPILIKPTVGTPIYLYMCY